MRAWFIQRQHDRRVWSPYGWVDHASRSYAYRYASQEDAARAIEEVRRTSPQVMEGAGFLELPWQPVSHETAGVKSDYNPFGHKP